MVKTVDCVAKGLRFEIRQVAAERSSGVKKKKTQAKLTCGPCPAVAPNDREKLTVFFRH